MTRKVFFLRVSGACSAHPGLLPGKEKFVFRICQVGLQNSTQEIRQITAQNSQQLSIKRFQRTGEWIAGTFWFGMRSRNKLSWLASFIAVSTQQDVNMPCSYLAKSLGTSAHLSSERPLLKVSALCQSTLYLFKVLAF